MKKIFKLVPIALLGFCLVLNSCSEENYDENQMADIPKGLSLTSAKFNEVSLNAIPKSNQNQTPIFLSNENATTVDMAALNSVSNLDNLITFSRTHDLNLSDTVDNQMDLLQTFYVDESMVLQTLQPNIQEAKVFLSTYGFTDTDYIEEFGSANSEQIITTALLVSAESNMAKVISPFEVFSCATAAIGTKDLLKAISGRALSSVAARRALLGIVRASAIRASLGPIGVAIMVAEFAWCLHESDKD